MKQKVIKHQSDLFKQEVTLTIDENPNKLKGKVLALKKLNAANKALKKAFGSFESSKSAEEIIKEIRDGRTFNRQIEML